MDDTFAYSHGWLEEFCSLYSERIKLPFGVNGRADIMNEEMLDTLKDAGCKMCFFGVETGNENLRYNVCNKRITTEQIKNAFRWCAERGIATIASFIIGLPYETVRNSEETKQLIIELNADINGISIFCPFPGTEAAAVLEKKGWLKRKQTLGSSFASSTCVDMPGFTSEQIDACVNDLRRVDFELQLNAKTRGYYDFSTHFEAAGVQSQGGINVEIASLFDKNYEKVWIFAHPPCSITYDNVPVREHTDLVFGIGVVEDVYDKPGGGVEFNITVGGKNVFSGRLNPKRKEKDRGCFSHRVPLDGFAGKAVSITFNTTAFGRGGNAYCSSGWGRPYLEQNLPNSS